MSAQLWEYLGPGGEPVGPQSLADLQDWMKKRFMDGDQKVRPLGGSHWVELRNASWATYHAMPPGLATPAPAAPGSWAAKTANTLPSAPRAAIAKPSNGHQGSGQASSWGSVSNWGAPAPPTALHQQAAAAAAATPAPVQVQRYQQQGASRAPPPTASRNGSKQGRNGGRKQKSVGYVEDRQWLFKRRGEVQGPFTGPEMREFLEDEAFFDQEVMVKKTDWKDYKPLEQVFEIVVQMYSLPPARSAPPPQEPLSRASGGSYSSSRQASLGPSTSSSSRSTPDAWEEDTGVGEAPSPAPASVNHPRLAAKPQAQPTASTPSAWGLQASPAVPTSPPQQHGYGADPDAATAPPAGQQQAWGGGSAPAPPAAQQQQAWPALPAAVPAQMHITQASHPPQELHSAQESEELPAYLAGLSLAPPPQPAHVPTPSPADTLAPISAASLAPVPAYAPAINPAQATPTAATDSMHYASGTPSSSRPRPAGLYRPLLFSSKAQSASSAAAPVSFPRPATTGPGASKPPPPGFTGSSSAPASAPAAPPGFAALAQQLAAAAQAVPEIAAVSPPKKALTWSEMNAARRAAAATATAAAAEGSALSAASAGGLGPAAARGPPPGIAPTALQPQQQQHVPLAAPAAAGPSAPSSPLVSMHAVFFPKESKGPSPGAPQQAAAPAVQPAPALAMRAPASMATAQGPQVGASGTGCVSCGVGAPVNMWLPCAHMGHCSVCLPDSLSAEDKLARAPSCALCGQAASHYMRVYK